MAQEFDPAQLVVFGPVVGAILALFIWEWVVPGPTHRRVIKDNERLQRSNDRMQRTIEKVVPLAQGMVEAAKKNSAALEDVVDVLEKVTHALDEARSPKSGHTKG
ncbi:hypothetical protein [Microbispora sp. NPDC049633]|uniref:hypothetical protein n=1 Tax=Microbispora sp. NPDC049633 TaxID=3154355 RepID=UPI003448C479